MIHAAYLGSEWLGPSQGQLDPVKEITAEMLACSEGFSTHEQSTIRLNGGQWDANVEQLRRENEKLGDKAPDPHQSGQDSGEPELPEETSDNPHDPKQVESRSQQAVRDLVLRESIKKAFEGG